MEIYILPSYTEIIFTSVENTPIPTHFDLHYLSYEKK